MRQAQIPHTHHNPRAIAVFDLDRTLVDEAGEPYPGTLLLFQTLHQAGIPTAIVTHGYSTDVVRTQQGDVMPPYSYLTSFCQRLVNAGVPRPVTIETRDIVTRLNKDGKLPSQEELAQHKPKLQKAYGQECLHRGGAQCEDLNTLMLSVIESYGKGGECNAFVPLLLLESFKQQGIHIQAGTTIFMAGDALRQDMGFGYDMEQYYPGSTVHKLWFADRHLKIHKTPEDNLTFLYANTEHIGRKVPEIQMTGGNPPLHHCKSALDMARVMHVQGVLSFDQLVAFKDSLSSELNECVQLVQQQKEQHEFERMRANSAVVEEQVRMRKISPSGSWGAAAVLHRIEQDQSSVALASWDPDAGRDVRGSQRSKHLALLDDDGKSPLTGEQVLACLQASPWKQRVQPQQQSQFPSLQEVSEPFEELTEEELQHFSCSERSQIGVGAKRSSTEAGLAHESEGVSWTHRARATEARGSGAARGGA